MTTDTAHIEVKRWENWKDALGQLIVYGDEMPREELIVYFYGDFPVNSKETAVKHLQFHQIAVYDLSIVKKIGRCELVITNMTLGSIVNTIQCPDESVQV